MLFPFLLSLYVVNINNVWIHIQLTMQSLSPVFNSQFSQVSLPKTPRANLQQGNWSRVGIFLGPHLWGLPGQLQTVPKALTYKFSRKHAVGSSCSVHPACAVPAPSLERAFPLTCGVFFTDMPFLGQLEGCCLGRTSLSKQAKSSRPGSWSAGIGSRLRSYPDKRQHGSSMSKHTGQTWTPKS